MARKHTTANEAEPADVEQIRSPGRCSTDDAALARLSRLAAGPWTSGIDFAQDPSSPLQSRHLSLTPGTRLGVYEATVQVREGGLGQGFGATDTRLKRQVAIKILPPSLAADVDRLARFQREAEVSRR